MLRQALSFLIPIFYLMLSVSIFGASSSNIYIQCSQQIFTPLTPYQSNVDSLFNSIAYSSSLCSYNKFTINSPLYSESDAVYGLYQCQIDLNILDCYNCVTNSLNQLKTNCPVSTGGVIQLDGCIVKYDSSCFFGDEDKSELSKMCGQSIGYNNNSDVLKRIDATLEYLISNGEYFRSGDNGSIEAVAQCVQDLSLSDCQDCLVAACGRLRSECGTSSWGNMYLAKCYITYVDVDQGKDSNVDSRSSGSNSSNSNSSDSNKPRGGKSFSTIMKWVGIICGVLVLLPATYGIKVQINNCCSNKTVNTGIENGKMELALGDYTETKSVLGNLDHIVEIMARLRFNHVDRDGNVNGDEPDSSMAESNNQSPLEDFCVPVFENMDRWLLDAICERSLIDAICERLKPCLLTDHNYIVLHRRHCCRNAFVVV
ncbi:plasmodesmata-located protein 5-like [Rutidosis leptorrhynchoides]|uniref:plasmodesmata-located protein 5-like n=1 Tax=Rutidosis leptorrhynchoides TaxID=125765 RepID=UPI003A995506